LKSHRLYPSWIVGLNHEGRGHYCAKHLSIGTRLELRREPDNSHDPGAVALIHRGRKIGYVPQRHRWVSLALDYEAELEVTVEHIEFVGWIWKRAKHVGLQIAILSEETHENMTNIIVEAERP
jgi:hypothetical protein